METVAATVLLMGLLGCAPALFGSAGVIPDPALAAQVEKRLRDANFDSVGVTVNAGIADLTGTVDRLSKVERAVEIARKTKGLAGVRNDITVASEQTDEQIAQAITHEIRMYPFYDIFDWVQGEVNSGVVTLSGQVRLPQRKNDYANLASQVRGVKMVKNELEVLPLSSFDDQIRLRLARAIYGTAAIGTRYGFQAQPAIHIIVKDGNVTLKGLVANQLDKQLIESRARTAGLYFSLDDQLRLATA
jgi:hyperosmotically inducible protein